jgi:hypothetical protein
VTLLLEKKTGVAVKDRFAAQRVQEAAVGLLVTKKDTKDWAPLHCAAKRGDENMVGVLLKKRADVDVRMPWTLGGRRYTLLPKAGMRGWCGWY